MSEVNSEKIEQLQNEDNHEKIDETANKKKKWDPLNIILYVVGCYLIALLLTTHVFTLVTVDGASMYPTLNSYTSTKCESGMFCESFDIAFCDLLTYKFTGLKRFDIIVISGEAYNEDEAIVKRVIGLPNETIKYQNGKLYVNDVVVEEDFISENAKLSTSFDEITLNKDEYYVLGDNRSNSKDSRMVGPIHEQYIIGRGLLKYLTIVKDYNQNNKIVDFKLTFPHVVK